jgi:hypothetical protein
MGNTGVVLLFLVQYTLHKIRIEGKKEYGDILAKLRVHCYMKFGKIRVLNLYLYQNCAITLPYTVSYTFKIRCIFIKPFSFLFQFCCASLKELISPSVMRIRVPSTAMNTLISLCLKVTLRWLTF